MEKGLFLGKKIGKTKENGKRKKNQQQQLENIFI